MKIELSLDTPVNNIMRYAVFALLMVLLVFGVGFSKFSLGGALYLNDILLVMITGITFLLNPAATIPVNFLLFSLISVVYFILSFIINSDVQVVYIFRQFMLCGYFIQALIIFTSLFQQKERYLQLLAFLKKISILAFYLDLVYVGFLFITGANVFGQESYISISPLAVLGVIVFFALHICIQTRYKLVKLVTAFVLLVASGHSSAVLAAVFITSLYVASFLPRFLKVAASVAILVVIPVAIFIFRSLTDANAVWRLVYWGYTAKRIFIDNFGVLGNGFGVRYANEELSRVMKEVYKFSATLKDDADAFTTPLHNAFLTFSFHVGFLPFLLIAFPIIRAIFLSQVYRKGSPIQTDDERFLALAVSGLTIWVGFNVILELPHSSLFFWMIYFCYYFYRKFKPEQPVLPVSTTDV